jgi:hypothetical protein
MCCAGCVAAVPAEQLARQDADSAARMWGDETGPGSEEGHEEQHTEDVGPDASVQSELSVSAASAAAHFLA